MPLWVSVSMVPLVLMVFLFRWFATFIFRFRYFSYSFTIVSGWRVHLPMSGPFPLLFSFRNLGGIPSVWRINVPFLLLVTFVRFWNRWWPPYWFQNWMPFKIFPWNHRFSSASVYIGQFAGVGSWGSPVTRELLPFSLTLRRPMTLCGKFSLCCSFTPWAFAVFSLCFYRTWWRIGLFRFVIVGFFLGFLFLRRAFLRIVFSAFFSSLLVSIASPRSFLPKFVFLFMLMK